MKKEKKTVPVAISTAICGRNVVRGRIFILFVYLIHSTRLWFLFSLENRRKSFSRDFYVDSRWRCAKARDVRRGERDTATRTFLLICGWKTGLLWLRHERLHRREGRNFFFRRVALSYNAIGIKSREQRWKVIDGYLWPFLLVFFPRKRPRTLIGIQIHKSHHFKRFFGPQKVKHRL